MERYHMTEEEGTGIVPVSSVLELEFGIAYAHGVQDITLGSKEPEAAILSAVEGFREKGFAWHYTSVLEGLLWGYYYYVLPRLLDDYDVMGVEPEVHLVYPFPPKPAELMFMSRPDLVLRRRSDGTVWVPDDKTTRTKEQYWLDKWPYAIQLQLQAAAVAQNHPEWDVQGAIVLGAYKGYERDGNMYSPFAYGYRTTIKGPDGTPITSYSARYVRGWERFPINAYTYAGGMQEWVRVMPKDVLEEQFPITRPIFLNQPMLEKVLEERLFRESRIDRWRTLSNPSVQKTMIPLVFDHRTINCNNCGYREACWNPTVAKDPLASGLYVRRKANHALEAISWEESANQHD